MTGSRAYDVIIAGARCAGSPTAMLLARRGYRVLMVDKAGFPSDTMSGHYVHQPGVACLHRWGLRDAVAATNCPPISTIRFDVGPFALEGRPPAADGVTEAFCCRRYKLDEVLLDAALDAGAELREHLAVQDLVWEDGRVTGIRTASGVEHARIVIGADGLHSLVARLVEAPIYEQYETRSFGYYTYWRGFNDGGKVHLLPRDDRMIGVAPTNDGKTMVFYQAPIAQFHEHRSDIEGHYFEAMNRDPWLAEQVHQATRVERFMGTADLPNFMRKPYGPGWALVGDAGYHKDPITGQGITDAFHCAELLAEAIDAGFAGRKHIDAALADYEDARNRMVGPLFHLTLNFARCEPPPEPMQQLIGALRGNQAGINAFLGCIAGTTNIPHFFSEENLGELMAAAATV
jgi:flavin-dependent dehydrogenase